MHIKPRSVLFLVLGAALLAGLLYVTLREDPVPVDLYTATSGPMRVTIDADGRTRIREVYEVAAPISGTAQRAPVRPGDAVTGGETLVAVVEPVAPGLLDSRSRGQAEAAVQEARAALHVAETDAQRADEARSYAASQLDRIQTLAGRGVTTRTQVEDASQQLALAEAALEAARARVELQRGTLARAEAALIEPGAEGGEEGACCVRLTAPVSGLVLEVPVVSERPVSAGTVLLTVGDPEDLQIVADLLSSDAVRVPAGARAIVERWGGPDPLEARLRRIEPSARTRVSALGIEEQRVDALFDITSPPEVRAGLADGFAVFLRIIEWENDDALQVPLSALFRRGEGWAVYTAADGIATETPLEIGHRNDTMAEVLSGLSAGQQVIVHPSDAVSDGGRIALRQMP